MNILDLTVEDEWNWIINLTTFLIRAENDINHEILVNSFKLEEGDFAT